MIRRLPLWCAADHDGWLNEGAMHDTWDRFLRLTLSPAETMEALDHVRALGEAETVRVQRVEVEI